jgi:hypothetical protein
MRAIRSSVWNLPLTQLYARNWALYNRRILEFYLGHQASCLCLSIEQMVARGEQIIRYLNDAWEFSLTPKPMTSVFEPSRMKRSASTWEGMICEMLVPDVKRIYARLGAAEADTIPELAAHRGRA